MLNGFSAKKPYEHPYTACCPYTLFSVSAGNMKHFYAGKMNSESHVDETKRIIDDPGKKDLETRSK